ncbi:MAG TPA: flagellar hook-basal body complex protein FliE [Microvirga sp.]|jgi:flagellar hook-basal body complex protein FliE
MTTNAFAAGAYSAIQSLGGAAAARKPAGIGGGDFSALLRGAFEHVAETGKAADTQAMAVATGKADVVDVVTAVAESEAAIETLVAVRDRVIAAYEDIMRMPI